ncbi:unnamed protein product, partial [Rotaria sp. Silwood2]
MPSIPNFYWHKQKGSNSFGGVAILVHSSIKSRVIHAVENFLVVDFNVAMSSILIGAVYVPPKSRPPIDEFEKFLDKKLYIFGDLNAKHSQWGCTNNNSSGILLNEWMEKNGCVSIFPAAPTSRRSDAIIDFAISQDKIGWTCEVIDEGTSDHFPVIFSAPFILSEKGFFRKTNWKIFSFILSSLFTYWNASLWYPALISNLLELDMPLPLVRWIYQWLQGRTMAIHHGESRSKTIQMFSGAPQGSVLSATLFRLHIHFLPKTLARFCSHLFADDLALIIKGSIETTFTQNIEDLEQQADIAMKLLENFSKNLILPVNIKKTKMMLIHSIVSPSYPKVLFKNETIETVSSFKYLGV